MKVIDRHWKLYLDLCVNRTLLIVQLLVVVGVHLKVVESEFLLDALLERLSLLQGQGVGLGDDGHDVDNIRQLLQNNDINGLERVSRGLDEEQAAVNTGVLNVSFTLSCELLSQVRGVLILDILDDRVPAAVVVDKITIAGGIDDVES